MPDDLLDALERRFDDVLQSFHSVGQVTAVNPPRATVSVAGGTLNLGYPTYYTPVVGDVVQVIGRPGSQFIVCRLDFGGAPRDAAFDTLTANYAIIPGGVDATGGRIYADNLSITGNSIWSAQYDGAIRWDTDGALDIVNRAGTAFHGLRTSHLIADFVDSNGSVSGTSGSFRGGVDSSAGRVWAYDVGITGNSIFSNVYNGAVRWESDGAISVCTRDGLGYRGVWASNFAVPPSWRAYKKDQRPIAEYLGGASPGEVIGRLDLSSSWSYDPDEQDFDDGAKEHIGPKLDDLPENLRVKRIDEKTGEDRSGWDLAEMLTVALAAIQDQQKQIESLTKRVEILEARGPRPVGETLP